MRFAQRHAMTVVSATVLFGALLLIWVAAIRIFAIAPTTLPSPFLVVRAGAGRFGSLMTSLGITALATVAGLAASIVVGVAVALVFAQFRWARRLFYPYTILLQTVPIVAIAPLMMMWIGPGLLAVSLVAFIFCLAPIIANTTQGLIGVDRGMVDLFLVNNASAAQILLKLRLPHALPSLFAGIRIAAGIAVIGAITGEIFAGSVRVGVGGLGYAISYANAQMETDYLFALVAASAFLGFCFFFAAMFLEWYFLHEWHESARSPELE